MSGTIDRQPPGRHLPPTTSVENAAPSPLGIRRSMLVLAHAVALLAAATPPPHLRAQERALQPLSISSPAVPLATPSLVAAIHEQHETAVKMDGPAAVKMEAVGAPPPPPPPLTPDQLCTEGCLHAQDGTCDDGGPGHTTAFCAFGSDCTDCGIRAAPWRLPFSPVYLIVGGVVVIVPILYFLAQRCLTGKWGSFDLPKEQQHEQEEVLDPKAERKV